MRASFGFYCLLLTSLFFTEVVAVEHLPSVHVHECYIVGYWSSDYYRTRGRLSWAEALEKVLEDRRESPLWITSGGRYYETESGRKYCLFNYFNKLTNDMCYDCPGVNARDQDSCVYYKGNEKITIGIPDGYDSNGKLRCAVDKICDCNENLEGSECVPMEEDYAVVWEPNGAKLYQYPTNNQGQRCDPIPYDELDGCKTNHASSPGTGFGNPIDCATGQKVQIDTDYQGAGVDPLRYTRVYQSPLSDDPNSTPTSGLPWLNTSQPGFSMQTLDDGAQLAVFTIGHSVKRVFFSAGGGGVWSANPYMNPISLTSGAGGGRSISYNGKVYRLNAAGKTEAKEDRGIQRYTYSYNDAGLVSEIRNRFGAYLQFTYNADNRLIRLTDQAGSEIHYTYDTHGNLSEVIYPDSTPGALGDNPRKTYLYENSAFPYHLTGIIDESGLQFARYEYDENGRGILTEHADGAQRVVISYPEEGQAIVRFYRDIDAEVYREEAYTYEKIRGAYRLTSRTIQVCNDCATGTETWIYDYTGLLYQHESMSGIITNYTYDSDGRKLSEATDTNANLDRTTTYTWDTDLEKILTITTDTTVTTYNYDANGLLLSKTVTPVQ